MADSRHLSAFPSWAVPSFITLVLLVTYYILDIQHTQLIEQPEMAIETDDLVFRGFQVTELHPTIGAEISGLDFSQPIPDETFQDLLAAIAKVCIHFLFFWYSAYLFYT